MTTTNQWPRRSDHVCNSILAIIAVGLLFVLSSNTVTAQTNQNRPRVMPQDWESMGLNVREVQIPSIGLQLHLPLKSSYMLMPQSERRLEVLAQDQSWISSIDVQKTSNSQVSVIDVANETIKSNQARSSNVRVPKRASLLINGQQAERLTINFLPTGADQEVHAMYTIFEPLPNTFVIYKVWTKDDNADEVFESHKAVVNTMVFTEPGKIVEQQTNGINRTEEALAALDRSAYEAMFQPEQWFRIHNSTGETGDREIGYHRVREYIGPLGSVSGKQRLEEMTDDERTEGVIVQLMGRYLLPNAAGFYDVESISWMSIDRKREQWSIRGANYTKVQESERYVLTGRSNITGDRRGNVIQVISDMPPSPVSTVQLLKPRSGYINQPERYMLYRILNATEAASFGMYVYEPQLNKVVYRSENIVPGSPPMSESRRTVDSRPHQITLTKTGLVSRILKANGDITEPISLKELLRIWKSKGLPTGRGEDSDVVSAPTDDPTATKPSSKHGSSGKRR